MTVITKAIAEKKTSGKQLEQPLVVVDSPTGNSKSDPEAQHPRNAPGHYLIFRTRVLRFHNMPTICVFFIAFFVMTFGIMAGIYLYNQYARDQMQRLSTRWFSFPYEGAAKAQYTADDPTNNLPINSNNIVKPISGSLNFNSYEERSVLNEQFVIDIKRDYEKILPDFRNGRHGRFIHDFSINKTGIIDIDGECCYVMPLDREKVLPPHNMLDLLQKMYNGYYDVNTQIVRDTMKIIIPPIKDFSSVGTYIAYECQGRPIYMLEKVDMNVIKRSINKDQLFVQYAGRMFYEINIINMNVIE